jgi:hypothetical protein
VIAMRMKSDFLIPIEALQSLAANDNCVGDAGFTVRNKVTAELNFTLAKSTRDDGAP